MTNKTPRKFVGHGDLMPGNGFPQDDEESNDVTNIRDDSARWLAGAADRKRRNGERSAEHAESGGRKSGHHPDPRGLYRGLWPEPQKHRRARSALRALSRSGVGRDS